MNHLEFLIKIFIINKYFYYIILIISKRRFYKPRLLGVPFWLGVTARFCPSRVFGELLLLGDDLNT
jgi:hypothetical protein